MVELVRIAEWVFLFEEKGYWSYDKDGRVDLVKVVVYNRRHDECLSRLVEW